MGIKGVGGIKSPKRIVEVINIDPSETAADLVDKIRDKFNILEEGRGCEMRLFEREISVRQQDVFYRRLGDQAWIFLMNREIS